MKITSARGALYGLLGLASLLLTGIGYAVLHKAFSADNLIGILTGLWQVLVAVLIVATAGGLGERLLGPLAFTPATRAGLSVALGILILSTSILLIGMVLGTGLPVFAIAGMALSAFLFRDIRAWAWNLGTIRGAWTGPYEGLIALGAALLLATKLAIALAPPTGFDALVYHFALPGAFLEEGRIVYLPDSMFWGMPQIAEMLFLAAMRFAGSGAAAALGIFVGTVTLIGLMDHVRSRFSPVAAWTAVAALLAGESIGMALSSGYVEWMALLFGWAALTALDGWFQTEDRRLLILSGLFCGGALGTKYTAGVLLLACIFVLALSRGPAGKRVTEILLLGLSALAASLPWWTKNLLLAGNPFYPFFLPAGAMDALRLDFYQHVDVWRDWRAVVLLPWQAALLGVEGREGFSASIGPLLVALSPLAGFGWKSRSESQKRSLLSAAGILAFGLLAWAVASRFSGLLIQSRLYFVLFPAWALLAGAGLETIWGLKEGGVRFGRLAGALVLLMLGLSIFTAGVDYVRRNPLAYILRLEDQSTYLRRSLGPFADAMGEIRGLPEGSRVLMLWEARGYYCQPRCDSDEIIDRWFHDSHVHPDAPSIIQGWRAEGYTHLLIFDLGADFVREHDPAGRRMDWDLLAATLAELTFDRTIAAGSYTLYRIP